MAGEKINIVASTTYTSRLVLDVCTTYVLEHILHYVVDTSSSYY